MALQDHVLPEHDDDVVLCLGLPLEKVKNTSIHIKGNKLIHNIDRPTLNWDRKDLCTGLEFGFFFSSSWGRDTPGS